MEQNKKKGGAGKVALIILGVLAVLGVSGFFALRALILSKLENMETPDISSSLAQQAPDFALELTDGSQAKLSELLKDNEVVVLNIFASWCGPCKKEFPEMEAVYEKYKDKMEIVAVSGDLTLDDMDDMIKYKEEHGLTFMVGMKNESIDSLTVGGFPTTYIIDRNGNIAYARTSAFVQSGEFEKVVTSLMGDDYSGKQIASYTFYVMDDDKQMVPGMQIHLSSDTVDETLTTGEDGMASYFTEAAHDLKVEVLNLPEGYTSNADEIRVGMDSGVKVITIGKSK
jgi:thiol-disulfide isomerase/thioredoxin